jgi:RNA polymerase sigma factor (sigma-70 family)
MLGDLHADEDLLAAARGGDPAACETLYDLVAPGVLKLVTRVVGRSAADDVFQQTLMRMFERLTAYRSDAPFGRWVRAIALNHCRMHLRSPWQRARVLLDLEPEESLPLGVESCGPGGDDTSRDLALDLQRLFRHLSPRARAIVWLHDVEGCTHAEIAAAFGRSEAFSKSQLARAHARLRAAAAASPLSEPPAPRHARPKPC